MRRVLIFMLFCVLPTTALAQTPNPCDTNDPGPFVVTSARSFTAQWCTAKTATASDGTTVPERIDGFMISLDNGAAQDIGKATSLGSSTATNRDAWQWQMPSGVAKGSHTFSVAAWNYVLDPNTGQPTTTRALGPATAVPFTAVDPVYNLPPQAPTGGRIIK